MIVRELVALFGFQVDKRSAADVDGAIRGVVRGAKVLGAAIAGAAVVEGIRRMVVSTAQLGGEIQTTSERIGVGTRALQELRFAAGQADVSSEELTTGLRVLSRNANEARQGSKELGRDFRRLGVSVTGADGKLKPVDALLEELAGGFARLGSDTERAALAQSVFGRSGVSLVPLLKRGKDGIRALREEADALGGVLDDDLIQLSSDFDDSQKRLRFTLQGLKNVVAKALLPSFKASVDATIEWIRANREAIAQNIQAVFQNVARVLGAIASAMTGAVAAARGWFAALDPVRASLVKIGLIALGLAVVLALPGGALFLLIALVGLLIEDFQTWRAGGKSAIGELVAALEQLAAEFPNVSAAILSVGVAFGRVFGAMQDTAFSFIQFFVDLFTVRAGPIQAIKNFANNTLMILGDLFEVDLVAAVHGFISEIGAAFASVWRAIPAPLRGLLERGAAAVAHVGGTLAGALGIGGGAAAAPAAVAGRAPSAVSAQQTNNITVSVDAAGAQNPEAVAVAVGREVRSVLEAQNREALGMLSVVAPAAP
jgi:hypothetical protein